MTKLISAAAFGLALLLPGIALADSVNVNFEPPFTTGSISGQQGWSKAVNPAYDQAVVSNTYGYSSFGTQSFRISDAVTSGSFGDWVFAAPLTNAVGEADSTDGTFSPGTLQRHFEVEFDIAATQLAQQPGLHVSVSPDRGDGSRMSYLRFEDGANGINVFFDDVQGTTNPANFVETQIGTDLSRTIPHHIKLTLDTLDGPSNDVVKVWIDGTLVHTGTSWENYYRYDSEASAEQSPRIVKTVIIQARGTATPADAGKGYLFDNLSMSSGPIPLSTVKVTIDKFIDHSMATAASAASSAFPMVSTWSATNIGSGSGSYALSTTGFNSPTPYEAVTSDMTSGASYTTNEVTGGAVVGADCTTGQPYKLAGYSAGDTLAAAQSAGPSATVPNFTNITSDKFVIVWNAYCLPTPSITNPANNTTTTTAGLTEVDWTSVTDPAGGITYTYQASNSSATNPDGSFSSTVYSQGGLTSPMIPTPGTPAGTYYLQVQAKDADGNVSAWSSTVKVTVDNTVPPPPANACATPTVAPSGYTLRNGTVGKDTVMLAPFTMFVGMGGNDSITGPDGNYIVCGGTGNNTVMLGNGDDTVVLGVGNQTITLGNGTAVITTGNGNQKITTGDGDKTVTTGSGNDKITTGAGNDTINAGNGNNTVKAGAGNDTITTGNGNDVIDGGPGTDTCHPGAGHNTVTSCEL